MRDASPVELEKFWASQLEADICPEHLWKCLGPNNIAGRVTALTIHPHNPNLWFAGTAAGGVWVSNDAGESWNPTWSRFANQNIGALGVAGEPASHRQVNALRRGLEKRTCRVYSYPGSGVYQSIDSGLTWQPVFGLAPGANPIDGTSVCFRAVSAAGLSGIFGWRSAVSFSITVCRRACIFATSKVTQEWSLANSGDGGGYNCHSVLFHPEDQNILYASIEPDGPSQRNLAQSGFWKNLGASHQGAPFGGSIPAHESGVRAIGSRCHVCARVRSAQSCVGRFSKFKRRQVLAGNPARTLPQRTPDVLQQRDRRSSPPSG